MNSVTGTMSRWVQILKKTFEMGSHSVITKDVNESWGGQASQLR